MNILQRISRKILNSKLNFVTLRELSLIAEPLRERTITVLEGSDVVPFLQGLITNDMKHLTGGIGSMYALFLNNAGRVLYDSIIYRTRDPNTYLVESDKSISNELRRHLRQFRVRKQIEIESANGNFAPWVVFSRPLRDESVSDDTYDRRRKEVYVVPTPSANSDVEGIALCPDPRLKSLGMRLILPNEYTLEEVKQIFADDEVSLSTPDYNYRYHLYGLGVGEGVTNHPPGKCFPFEINADLLHGVSFQKGCYIGQELTARVHFTGVIRKRMMPIRASKKLDPEVLDVQNSGGNKIGVVRGVEKDLVLGLVRMEQALKLPNVFIDDVSCEIFVPNWWPKELPNKQVITNI